MSDNDDGSSGAAPRGAARLGALGALALDNRAWIAGVSLALTLGVAGGLTFQWLTMPLPWMLGSMAFTTLAAVLGAPLRSPVVIRPYVVVIIGVMLGSGFTPELFGQAGAWTLSFLFLGLYLVVAGGLGYLYYRRVGGFDPTTAYFAGMPGGFNEMIIIGRDMGADDRAIALAHASRILLVVCVVVFSFRWLGGHDLGDRAGLGAPLAAIPWHELGVLAAVGVAGFWLGGALRLPAPSLVGPMLLSAVVHLTGVSKSAPPQEIVIAAQVLLGVIIGGRFIGARPREVGHAILLSAGATVILLMITLAFALLGAGLFNQTTAQVLLAYSPGGLTEMSLVALAMQADVAYVASHHILRIALVILFASWVFMQIRPRANAAGDARRPPDPSD